MSQTPTPFKLFVNVRLNVNSVEKRATKVDKLIKAHTKTKNTPKKKKNRKLLKNKKSFQQPIKTLTKTKKNTTIVFHLIVF